MTAFYSEFMLRPLITHEPYILSNGHLDLLGLPAHFRAIGGPFVSGAVDLDRRPRFDDKPLVAHGYSNYQVN